MADNNNHNNKKKRSIFQFYDSQKVGKGVKKEAAPAKLNLTYFFKLYWRNLTNLGKINLLYVFGNFPFLFALYALTGNLNTNSFAPASGIFPPLYGAMRHTDEISPAVMALFGVHGVQAPVSLMTPLSYVFLGLAALVVFTFGFVNVGTTYLVRNIVKGEPIFFFKDFIYAIKRNWKQGLFYGVLDIIIIVIFLYNITLTYFNLGSTVSNLVFYANLLMIFVYFMMRFYVYLMMVTFDLSLFKLIKNAFIFSILGAKRNLMAVTGIALALLINYMVFVMLLPLGILIPFMILFATGQFMAAYAAWPKIKEIMIDPYYHDPDNSELESITPIFKDMG